MSTEATPTPDLLKELVNAFKAALQPPSPPPSASGSPMAMPVSFAGEAAECSGFLLQVNLFIQMQPQLFPSENAKVAFLISLLTGLKADIRAVMALYDDSIGLEAFLQRTTHVSRRLAACQPPVTAPQSASVAASSAVPEPMQVDSTHLSRAERNRRVYTMVSKVISSATAQFDPPPPPRPVVSTITSNIESAQLTLLPVVLHTAERSLSVSALVDSGSSGNFISQECLSQLQLSCQHHFQEYTVKTIQGKPLGCGMSCHSSPFITLQVDLFHVESIRFLVESPEPEIVPEIPAEYMVFQDVFSKQAATHLPTHRPWDCAIELLPGTQLPKGKVYPLSIPEHQLLRGQEGWRSYNLVRAGDEWKTAFITSTGHYKYRVMPYGLSISPSVFQTFMNEVFREFLHRFVVVYIDDILIYSRNQAEHRQHVQQVLQKLRDHSLYLKLEKCKFHQPSVQFLGYNISAEGVQMDQGKVNAILNWPPPSSIKELQCFLGFANFYRRFIKDYSSITAPLTSLLRGKPKHLTWNPVAHEAFQWLKSSFSTTPVLHHPDPERPFTVEVDASTTGVRAVLSQAASESSLLHPCAYFSHKLSPAEQNYDVGNRELLAIELALEEWRHWLEGANHPFTIITDHKNLQYLREARRLNPRQARWALFLPRFNFTITYRPGAKNIPADALSRMFSPDAPTEPEPIIPSNLIISPIIWDLDREIQQATLQEPALPECPEGKIYVPCSNVNPFWAQLMTLRALDTQAAVGPSRFYNLVTGGPVCTMTPSGKLVPLPIPQRPWSHLGIDFITDLPISEAMETAEQLFHQVFRHFGLPEEIVSDRGPQFISHVWKAFFKLLGISVNLSSGYHPQTNGQTERKIQELGRYLRAYCQDDQHSWSRFLPWAEYTQNSLHQDSTGLMPFQFVLGYQPPLFPWTEEPSNAVRRHKIFADARRRAAPIYQPGDLVWLSTRDQRLRLPCRKLSPHYNGPFHILRQINEVTFQLQLPPRYRIHPTFHVSLLKPFSPSATDPPGAEAEPPPPEVLDQPSIFTVHEILDSRRRRGRLEVDLPGRLGGVRPGGEIL
ncbi:hypothetical protein M9458_055012, partial [Cirrhinus mrigala]